jgi:Transposase zinc-binding domain
VSNRDRPGAAENRGLSRRLPDFGILAHGFLRLHCGDCGHDKLVAFSCKRRGFCPSCGARRMAQTAAHLGDHVIPHVPVRQWVLSLPIPLRLLLAEQPKLVTPVLQVVQRVITRRRLGQAGLKADEADSGAVTLIQRFGSAAISTFTFTAWSWTASTGAAPTARRSLSKPPRQPTRRFRRCCTKSSPAR